jgi:hypothetical protein
VPAAQGSQGGVDRKCSVLQDPLHLVADGAFEADAWIGTKDFKELRNAVLVVGAAALVDGQNVHA